MYHWIDCMIYSLFIIAIFHVFTIYMFFRNLIYNNKFIKRKSFLNKCRYFKLFGTIFLKQNDNILARIVKHMQTPSTNQNVC